MGFPNQNEHVKEPMMQTSVIRNAGGSEKGIESTLYDPRLNFNLISSKTDMKKMQNELCEINKHVGHTHIIPNELIINSEVTKFGAQYISSPLSYQLPPVNRDFDVLTDLEKQSLPVSVPESFGFCSLPFGVLKWENSLKFNDQEKPFLEKF